MSDAQSGIKQSASELVSSAYSSYYTELCKYVVNKFRMESAEAEDAVQTAFAKLSACDQVGQIENCRAFLYRTVGNIVIDYRRHQRVQEAYKAIAMSKENEATEDHTPERIVDARQRLNIIERAMWHMPEKRRRLLLMNRYEHLSYAEIARRVGLSETVVRKHVVKALVACHKALAQRDAVVLSGNGSESIVGIQGDLK